MLNFINDAGQLLRMRFKPIADYRYSPGVIVAILLVLAVGDAQTLMPIFGLDQYATVAIAFLFTVLNWQVSSKTMKVYLHYMGAPKLPLANFVLLGQALAIPAMLFVYLPAAIALFVSVMWLFWSVWVRVHGLARGSDVPPIKVLLGYVVCFFTMMLASVMVLVALISFGVLDANVIIENIEVMQQGMAP